MTVRKVCNCKKVISNSNRIFEFTIDPLFFRNQNHLNWPAPGLTYHSASLVTCFRRSASMTSPNRSPVKTCMYSRINRLLRSREKNVCQVYLHRNVANTRCLFRTCCLTINASLSIVIGRRRRAISY